MSSFDRENDLINIRLKLPIKALTHANLETLSKNNFDQVLGEQRADVNQTKIFIN